MNPDLKGSIFQVCTLLNKLEVDFIIVGGVAVALNGYYRHSINAEGKITDKPDLDIWFNPTYENYFKLLSAIEEIGQDISDHRSEKQPNPMKSFFKIDI